MLLNNLVNSFSISKVCRNNIEISIISDNRAEEKITSTLLDDFYKDRGTCIEVYKSKELFHNRYIFLDYKEDGEEMYHSGSSSKDAGNKVTTILKEEYHELYHPLLDRVLRTEK